MAWPRFSKCWPISLNTAATRPASVAGVLKVVPSPAVPASRRTTDILPPWVVWKVLSTSATASAPGLTPRRWAVSAAVGASCRNALSRRNTPLLRLATPSSTGQSPQHADARFLLAVEDVARELDDLRRRVLLVDIGALEREIDEAGEDVAVPDRDLTQQQRHARGRLQQLDRLAHALVGSLVDLVEEQKVRNVLIFKLAQDQLQLRHLLLVGLADHDRRVDRGQHAAHVVADFARAGPIDEGVTVVHERGGGEGRLHAHLVIAGFLAGVAHRVAGIHRALPLHRAGAGEDRF